MSKIFILFLLFSTTAFAKTVILQKHAVSGFVMPEDSFVKDCKIYREGFMEAETINGDGTAIGTSRTLADTQVHIIRLLNRLARRGSISESVNPCDIGTIIVKGYHGKQEVELESSLDCGSKRLNGSAAANVLRSMASEICGF